MNIKRPIVGIHKQTNSITPITIVTETGLKCNCNCYECDEPLEAVLNTTSKIHFRHSNKSNCNPSPETQLHLLAKFIIVNNKAIHVPGMGFITYTNPVAELKREDDLIPDVIVDYDNMKLFIEIIVSNPITKLKYEKYKFNNSFVLLIDLSQEDRELDSISLTDIILHEHFNKRLLKYTVNDSEDISETKANFTSIWVSGITLLVLAGAYIYRKFHRGPPVKRYAKDKRKKSYRKYYL